VSVWSGPALNHTLQPRWQPVTIGLQRLCNGNNSMALVLSCWDSSATGASVLIGEVETSVNELLELPTSGARLQLFSSTPGDSRPQGYITVASARVQRMPSIAEFIATGGQISLMMAVDFTSSNGDPASPTSLHHVSSNKNSRNAYQKAIAAIGGILLVRCACSCRVLCVVVSVYVCVFRVPRASLLLAPLLRSNTTTTDWYRCTASARG
jgi:hypothetical protein